MKNENFDISAIIF